jgi:hypothetical protein
MMAAEVKKIIPLDDQGALKSRAVTTDAAKSSFLLILLQPLQMTTVFRRDERQ